MEIENTSAEVNLDILLSIKFENLKIIKQQSISNKNDIVHIGIYEADIFKDSFFIIAVNRVEQEKITTLDYTKYAKNIAAAEEIYIKIKNEVMVDIRR